MRGVSSISAVLQMNKYGRRIGYVSASLFVLLAAMTVCPISFGSNGVEAANGIANSSETSISLVSASNVASVDLAVDNPNGVFAMSTSAQQAEFAVTTNNYTGYVLNIVSEDNTGRLNNSIESTYIESISSSMTAASFDNATNNNKWGYKPNKYVELTTGSVINNTGDDALFFPAVDQVGVSEGGLILDITNAANAEANHYTIALGARADLNIADGTYTGSFSLVAVAKPTPYTISYNKNTEDTVTNMPTAQADSTNADYVVLSSSTPARSGHLFLGWCPVQPTNVNGVDVCAAPVYRPGDNYDIDHTASTSETLYALWHTGTTKTYIQDITAETCPAQTTIVFDSRDEEPYAIQKLEDGYCWMLDNLRLDLTNSSVQGNLTVDTTNASNATLNYLKNGGGTTSDKYATAGVANWDTANSFSAPLISTTYKDTTGTGGYANGKYGVYYNYCAVSAGSYCFGDGESYGSPSGDVTEDICPKGWRLPTGGDGGEYQVLYTTYNSNYTSLVNAVHLPLSGGFLNGVAQGQGSYGNYWSSTHHGAAYAKRLYLLSTGTNPTGHLNRSDGNSVRCVIEAELEPEPIQSITFDTCPTTPTTVVDSRDGEEYTIQQLADGNCWMLDNLRLGGDDEITLTPSDTNIASNYTLPASTIYDYVDNFEEPRIYAGAKDETESYGDGLGKLGVYYNYCAVSGGTICTDENEENATYDICPKGWRLPTSGYDSEYGTLVGEYSALSADGFRNVFHFVYAGTFGEEWESGTGFADHGSIIWRGESADAWSATNIDLTEMGAIGKTNDPNAGVTVVTSHMRYYGVPVRCMIGDNKYSITYDGNGADAGTMNVDHTDIKEDDVVWLIASNYSRAGYGFIGWSTDADAATKFTNGQNVTIYGPNEEVTIDSAFLANADSNRNVTLYAVWIAQDATKTMQTFTTSECTAMSIGDIIVLKDTRDNEAYAISKLADNHCWMIENMRLNPKTANITADNTNNPTQTFLDALGSSQSNTTLCGSDDTACIDTVSYNLNNIDRTLEASYNDEVNARSWYSYGGMYNWYTAMAGNGTYSITNATVSTGDICPTGWRLPTGGTSGEVKKFNKAVNNNTEVTGDDAMLKVFPNNMVYGGDYNRTVPGGRGRYLRYSTSTSYSATNVFRFGAEKTNVTPQKYYKKWAAFAVRCIVK